MPASADPAADTLPQRLTLAGLAAAYAAASRPEAVLQAVLDRISATEGQGVWISRMPAARAQAMLAAALERQAGGASLPLLGMPFAVKDNIDVAGLPTTAGCPDFAYWPERSATVVERLVAAGAIPVGKTNLDQFATGLNGTRSPYGVPASVFDATRVSGGSSSGSAVAVADGAVPFALGTDTAGSGRIPAAFNGLVGLKPTRGLFSTTGLVPACRSLDCISILAQSVEDALAVARVASGADEADPFSRAAPDAALDLPPVAPGFRFGLPDAASLAPCAPAERAGLDAMADALRALGGVAVTVDLAPFLEAAALLYAGPWVAERLAAIRDFAAERPDSLHPVVREIILGGGRYSAVDAFEAQYRLASLIRATAPAWQRMDVLLLPTAPEHPTIAAMLADPIGANARLGTYTNFVNLMDLCALAIPAGNGPDGLPVGVTLVGQAFRDGWLAALGARLAQRPRLSVPAAA